MGGERLTHAMLAHGAGEGDGQVGEACALATARDPDALRAVIRPAFPVLLLPMVALWAGLCVAEQLTWQSYVGVAPVAAVLASTALVPLLLLAGGAGILMLVICARSQHRVIKRAVVVPVCLVGLWLGLCIGLMYWGGIEVKGALLQSSTLHDIAVKVVDDPKQGAISQTSLGRVTLPQGQEVLVRIFWDGDEEPLPYGTCFAANLSFTPLKPNAQWLHQQGVCGSVKLLTVQQPHFEDSPLGAIEGFRHTNALLIGRIEGPGAALLQGVLLGDTTALDGTDVYQAFKTTGLAHLIAVSGSHLAVIAVLLMGLLTRLPGNRTLEFALLALFLVAYVVLTGLQPSALRACVMTLTAAAATFVGRRAHAPTALAAAALAMLALYPPNAYAVGFWLSVCAVLGLTMYASLARAWVLAALPAATARAGAGKQRRRTGRVARTVAEPLALTLTAQGATLPLTIPLFSMVSFIGPLANLLVTPLVTILVGGGIVALCLAPVAEAPAFLLLQMLGVIGDGTAWLAQRLAAVPGAAMPFSAEALPLTLVCLVAALLAYGFWPQPQRGIARALGAALVAAALVLGLGIPWTTGPQLVVMDVGQGDALIVRDGRHTVLIDTGESASVLVGALGRNHITHLDAVVITHLDADHCGALAALQGMVGVDRVLFASGLPAAHAQDEVMRTARALLGGQPPGEVVAGDRLQVSAALSLEVVWPLQPVQEGGNPNSVCLLMRYDPQCDGAATPDTTLLLTGDAEAPELRSILAQGAVDAVQVLKVGHHGSADAVTVDQLAQMGTRIALISVGEDNRYGHPTAQTLGVLEAGSVTVFRTDLNGDISVALAPDALHVSCATMSNEISSR